MLGEGEGLQQLPPSAGFSSLCLILGSLRRDLGPSAVVLLIPECVFHRSLCVQTLGLALPPYPLAREGTESPDNWGHSGVFPALCVGQGVFC